MIAGLWGSKESKERKESESNASGAPKPISQNGDTTVSPAGEPPSAPAPEAATPEADIADTGLMGLGLPPPHIVQPEEQPSEPVFELKIKANPNPSTSTLKRPPLPRGGSAPIAPPNQPPPPAPGAPQARDSLTLQQLQRIVADFPARNEPTIYAYSYGDAATFEEEIDEWFSYSAAENNRIKRCGVQFGTRWKTFSQKSWIEESWDKKKEFVKREVAGLESKKSEQARRKSLCRLMHILLGVWDETAGLGKPLSLVVDHEEHEKEGVPQIRSQATASQLKAMKEGVKLITEVGGEKAVYNALRTIFDSVRDEEYREAREAQAQQGVGATTDEIDNIMTVMYVIIEVTRCYPSHFTATKAALASLQPTLLTYLLTTLSTLRWDDSPLLPQSRLFTLFHKSLLLLMGSMSQLDAVKVAVAESLQQEGRRAELITASPLDYHIFRQEITSKYPAYVPPAPLLPLDEGDNNILPSLHHKEPRGNGTNGVMVLPAAASSGSILHQPVHIATPAPSPPPSPPVGGKAGKKQNYQTNQNFPFLYPPLDSTSGSAGGKGAAGLHSELIGRKWEGREIPASILEAGELFSKRTKMTRAMRQLWDEKEAFLKFERGWVGEEEKDELDEDLDVDEFRLEEVLTKRLERLGMDDDEPSAKKPKIEIDTGPRPVSNEVKQHLETVEFFFIDALPHLQSLVIVLLKAILSNVTALITQPLPGQNAGGGLQSAYQSEVNLRAGVPGMQRQRPGQTDQQNGNGGNGYDVKDLPLEDVELLRQREVSLKAVAGILLTLLKWFKVSHILKFEYLTQLLLDANYLPLVLKFFAHTDVDKLVDTDCERTDKQFFSVCNRNAKKSTSPTNTNHPSSIFSGMGMGGGPQKENASPVMDSDTDGDDACPPPIKISRSPLSGMSTDGGASGGGLNGRPQMPPNPRTASAIHSPQVRQQLDENGQPIPQPPSTMYSSRNFMSSINLLRVMHKISAGKTHRLLLLVQYKSSAILKKALKVQEPNLRKYTLKLFKGQVPFCGRKWRQGNMRVITQVYLELRPQLREEWLSGGEVEGRVEESGAVEVAGRSIVGWGLGRRYKDVLHGGRLEGDAEDEPSRDFFRRELEKMAWSGEVEDQDEEAEEDWEGVGIEMLRDMGGRQAQQQGVVDGGISWASAGKWVPRP